MAHRLFLLAALMASAPWVWAQAVRTSPDAFPIAPAPLSLPVAPAAAIPKALIEPEPVRYQLRTGEPIHKDLQAWAEREGWELVWQPNASWRTLRSTQIEKNDIGSAVTEVIDILRDEGKPVRLRISDGNKVMEVISTEIRND